jgi:hypothetical protein
MNHLRPKHVFAQDRGVVLVIAILFSSVALAIGMGVYTRTYKELLLASFWKESQIAFAAADAGLECALYWETHPGAAACFGVILPVATWTPGDPAGGNFSVDAYNGCARVTIIKNPLAVPPAPSTIIESRGQSEVCGSSNPRRVERGVKLSY